MKTLIYNIKELIGILPKEVQRLEGEQMGGVSSIKNAYLIIKDGIIDAFGKMEELAPNGENISLSDEFEKKIDAEGRLVLPTFCDSHTQHVLIILIGFRQFANDIVI